jgi:hypothetical protein
VVDRDVAVVEHLIEGGREILMDRCGIGADEVRLVAVAGHQRREFVGRDAGQHGRVRDLVAVEVQHRQHRAISDRIKELVRMPTRDQPVGQLTDSLRPQHVACVLGVVGGTGDVDEQLRLVPRGRAYSSTLTKVNCHPVGFEVSRRTDLLCRSGLGLSTFSNTGVLRDTPRHKGADDSVRISPQPELKTQPRIPRPASRSLGVEKWEYGATTEDISSAHVHVGVVVSARRFRSPFGGPEAGAPT